MAQHESRKPSGDVPEDKALPALSRVLDTSWVVKLLAGFGDSSGSNASCRVSYVRYKPGTSCVVAYAFEPNDSTPPVGYMKLYSGSDFQTACSKLATRRWRSEGSRPPFVALKEMCAILFLFPYDAEMAGLRLFARPKGMQRVLYSNISEYPPDRWRISDRRIRVRVIRYKPEKRAVVRIDTRAVERQSNERRDLVVFGRVYESNRAKARYDFMRSLEQQAGASRVRVPHVLGCLPDDGILLVDRLEGSPVYRDELVTGEARVVLVRAGEALRKLHSCRPEPLEIRTRVDAVEDCAATARTIGAVAPDLSTRTAAIMRRLRALSDRVPTGATGFTHGDFHPGQLLAHEDTTGVLDFDRAHHGELLADLGNFCAHLLISNAGTPDSRGAAARAVVDGYVGSSYPEPDRDELDLWTAIGLLNLTVQPFRSLEPDWQERMAMLLTRCEEVLG